MEITEIANPPPSENSPSKAPPEKEKDGDTTTLHNSKLKSSCQDNDKGNSGDVDGDEEDIDAAQKEQPKCNYFTNNRL